MKFNSFLESDLKFEAEENFLKFQFRTLNSVLIVIFVSGLAYSILGSYDIIKIGQFQSNLNLVYSVISLSLVFFLRFSKSNYLFTTNLILFISFIVFISALINVPEDEFRVIWLYLLIFVAYMLRGYVSGIIYTFLSIIAIVVANNAIDINLSSSAIFTIIISLTIGSLLSFLYTNKVDEYREILEEKNSVLNVIAYTDSLTGIMNQHFFDEHSDNIFLNSKQKNEKVVLMLLNLDNLKKLNDAYGHDVGDLVIIRFVEVVNDSLKKSDIFARLDGETFAVVLFNEDEEHAFKMAENIRVQIEHLPIFVKYQDVFVTTSIGLSESSDDDAEFNDILLRAKKALYQAKKQGRNRVCL